MEAELDTRCPVCLDNWDSAAYAMPCCHQFCFPCIQRWTSTRPQCPLCKRDVKSIIHTVQADDNYQELVVRPPAEASIATRSPAVRQAAAWPAVPMRPVGGLSPATWASLFREHPALLRPLRSWLRQKLRRILGTEEPQANTLLHSVIWALLLVGLAEGILIEMLDPDLHGHTVTFVRQFIAFAVQRCARAAHRLLGPPCPPAAGHRRPLHHSPELPHQRRHLSLAQYPPAALPALTGTKCWAGQQKSSMGIPAAHIPTLQLSPRSRQRLTRSQKRLWQGLLAPAHLRGPGEPQRGRPATHRPQRHQRRGHPAGRNRRVVELMRLGPGTTWDTPWPQWTHVISVQFLCGNKIQRLKTTTKKMCSWWLLLPHP